MMAFLFWHQILELEHLALARRQSGIFGHFWPLKLCVERSFLKKLAAFCGYSIASFKLSQILFRQFYSTLDTILADSCDIFENVAGMGLEAAPKQNNINF